MTENFRDGFKDDAGVFVAEDFEVVGGGSPLDFLFERFGRSLLVIVDVAPVLVLSRWLRSCRAVVPGRIVKT